MTRKTKKGKSSKRPKNLPPLRTNQHIIDERATKRFYQLCPEDWIVRELTSRDYGIDRAIEIFEGERPTGGVLFFQIKGCDFTSKMGKKILELKNTSGVYKFRHDVKNIKYSLLFSVPVILFFCPVNTDETPSFIWLQEYVLTHLDIVTPDWSKQATVTIEFPESNTFSTSGLEKLNRISHYHQFSQDLTFIYTRIESMRLLKNSVLELKSFPNTLSSRIDIFESLITVLSEIQKKISSLKSIIWKYKHQISEAHINNLIFLSNKIIKNKKFTTKDWVKLDHPTTKNAPKIEEIIEAMYRSISLIIENYTSIYCFWFDSLQRAKEYQRTFRHSNIINIGY